MDKEPYSNILKAGTATCVWKPDHGSRRAPCRPLTLQAPPHLTGSVSQEAAQFTQQLGSTAESSVALGMLETSSFSGHLISETG